MPLILTMDVRIVTMLLFLVSAIHKIGAQTSNQTIDGLEATSLLNLRGTLGIRSRYWPRKTDPCINWQGIACENGHVVSITLTGLRRTSTAALNPTFSVEPLRNFSYLNTFVSSGFSLPGSIPDWFGSISTLRKLDLSKSSIYASLPVSLGNLSNLLSFSVSGNNITGSIPLTLGNLTNLISLDLSYNGISGSIPAELGNLSNLQFLLLGSNSLQGSIPAELGRLTSLIRLDLSSNAISGIIPTSIGNLSSLVSLNLSRNLLNDNVTSELSRCTNLQILYLDQNSLTGNFPTSFENLSNITTLSLFSNNLTGMLPTWLSRSTSLQQVLLSRNLFYGTIPFVAANLTNITTLDLSSNYFNGSIPSPFVTGALLSENCLTDASNQRSIDECTEFYAARGLTFVVSQSLTKSKSHLLPILIGSIGGFFLALVVIALSCLVIRLRGRKAQLQPREVIHTSQSKPFSGNISVNVLCLGDTFSYSQLQQATGDFSEPNLLKAGHSGDLYQGLLEGGVPIVVKRIDLGKVKKDGYLAELDFFGKASHTRLVPLLGHCLEKEDEKLMVYKYMPYRDLGYALFKMGKLNSLEDTLRSLDWITRLKIAIGTAEALTYLHHECTPALVHRDIQASSILLEDKYEVRLGSLTEACVAVGEPHQGVFARLLRRSQTSDLSETGNSTSTCPYDVYCFGKVLLELVTGKLGISGSKDPSTELDWALSSINIYDRESISKILDPSLVVDEDLMEEVWAMAIVAKSCLNPKPSKRPLMRYILKALENPLKVVREDTMNSSGRSRNSSHGSWNAAIFASWRHSSSEAGVIPGSLREEYMRKNSLKHSTHNGGSQGSGQGEISQRRAGSSEIFPEPFEESAFPMPNNSQSDKQDS